MTRGRGSQHWRRSALSGERPRAAEPAACSTFFPTTSHDWANHLCRRLWIWKTSTYYFLNTESRASIVTTLGNMEMDQKHCDGEKY